MTRAAGTALALLGACHPLPSAAVTVFFTCLGAAAGDSAGTCVILALAVLAGQLSIGWSNDRLDVSLDRSAGRADKPLAGGAIAVRVADVAIAGALAVTVAASLSLGLQAGGVHLFAVACGWAYNLGLKATAASWLPYAVAFGSAPAIATLARTHPTGPTWWAVAAGALLGVGAHLTNTLPDLVADRDFGVRGLPHRIGARRSLLLAAAALLAGTVLLVLGPAGSPSALRWVGLAVAASATVVGGVAAWRRPDAAWAFRGTVAVAALDVLLLLLGPSFVA